MTPLGLAGTTGVVVVGCGLISSRWIRALSDDPRSRVVGLVDPDAGAAWRVASRCGVEPVPWFPDLGAALRSVPAEVAVNTAPAHLHAAISAEALARGLHVFSEKPLALRLDQACDLVAAARASERVLAVMSNRGADPRFLGVRDLIHKHSAGPYSIHAEMFVGLSDPGFRAGLQYPATTDLAVHVIDQVRRLVTAPPVRLRCVETPLPSQGPHCTVATLTIEFADTSMLTFRGGFTTAEAGTAVDGVWRIDAPGVGFAWEGGDTAVVLRGSAPPQVAQLPLTGGHRAQITAMLDSVHGGAMAIPEPLGSIALLDAALRALRSGEPVDLVGRWYP